MPPPLPEHELLRHARSLRALARRLVRDHHAAEDVVQDALVVALERPPRSRESIGGWLASVVRSQAHKHGRSEVCRKARERASARPERQAATDGAARAEALRRLADAVASLEEPYRTAVLLRWFEGLSPSSIARRLGAPVPTVKSQLQRGLAQLRARLDRDGDGESGSWVPGLAALSGAGASGLLTGGIVMAGNAKLAGAAVVLVAAGLGVFFLGPDGGSRPATPARGEDAAAPRPNAALVAEERGVAPLPAQTSEPRAAAAVASATPSERAAPLPPTHVLALEGTVADPWDRPVSGADVWVALPGMPPNRVARTDRAGHFQASFRAHLSAIDVWLAAGNRVDGQSGLRRMSLTAGSPHRAHLRLGGLPPPRPALPDSLAGGLSVRLLRNVASGPSRWADAPPLIGDEDTRLRFDAAVPPIQDHYEIQGALDLVQLTGTGGLDPQVFAIEVLAAWGEPEAEGADGAASVSGVVSRPDGEPAAGVPVGTLGDETRGARWAWTDEEGRFALTHLAPGEIELRAGGGDFGRATEVLRLATGTVSTWNPELDRGLELRGTLLDDEGAQRRGFWIELASEDPNTPWEDGCEVDSYGRFAIPNCPGGPLRLSVFPREGRMHLPALVREGVLAGGAPLELELRDDELPGGRLDLVLFDSEGEPREDLEIRALDPETGRGTHLVHGGQGRYRLLSLRAGRYVLEEVDRLLGEGWLGEVWIDGRGATAVGPISAPQPARATLDLSSASGLSELQWAIVALRPEAPVQVRDSEWTPSATQLIGPGHYEVWFRAQNLALLRAPLDLAPGQEVAVRVPLDLAPEVVLVGRRADGESVEGEVVLELRDLGSDDVALRTVLRPDTDGAARATVRLPAGSYLAVIRDSEGARSELLLEHGEGTPDELELELP